MTIKSASTDADEATFQTAVRERRASMPCAAAIVASQIHEDCGRLSDAVSELALRASRGDDACDHELVNIAADVYDLLAMARERLADAGGAK